MPSCYNVIKKVNLENNGKKLIDTDISKIVLEKEDDVIENGEVQSVSQEELKAQYEYLAKTILDKARNESEEIIKEAEERSQSILEEACQNGYNKGYEAGYKESYEKHMKRVQEEKEVIINNANNLLFNAKEEYFKYLEEKKKEIIDLSIFMAEKILKVKAQEEKFLDPMIEEVLNKFSKATTFIIKCHGNYESHLKENINQWKNSYALNSNIFVVKDDSLELGNAVIERENGKTIVGIDEGFSNIKKELLG